MTMTMISNDDGGDTADPRRRLLALVLVLVSGRLTATAAAPLAGSWIVLCHLLFKSNPANSKQDIIIILESETLTLTD